MTKVYAGPRSTFLLTASDGSTMLVRPNTFNDIPDKFTGDVTFRCAVASGDLKPFETVRQGDGAQRKALDGQARGKSTKEGDASPSPSPTGGKRGNADDAA